jgi:hypothetical protein
MTTTPLFQTIAQDATLAQVRDLTNPVLGNFATAGVGSVAQVDVTNRPIVTVQASGLSGSVTLVPQVSDDSGTWTTVTEVDVVENVGVATGVNGASITANGTYRVNTLGFPFFRLYQSVGTGSIALAMASMPGVGSVRLGAGGAVRVANQAAGAADPGIAALAFRAPATPAARSTVANYIALMADAEGKLVTAGTADPVNSWQGVATQATTTAVALKAAAATGLRNYLTDLTVTNSSATGTLATVLDGATVIWQGWLAAGQSITQQFATPLRGTAATAMNVNSSVAVTSLYAAASGYVGV